MQILYQEFYQFFLLIFCIQNILLKKNIYNLKRLTKFYFGYIFTFLISLIILPILVEIFLFHPWFANFITIIFVSLINYMYNKLIIFR